MSDLKLANLNDKSIKEIQKLEQDIGVNLVAYIQEDNIYATISPKNLEKIKKLEESLGLIILAYPSSKAA